jgi:serine phosphatase RsbU (regulator of sigma subunit)
MIHAEEILFMNRDSNLEGTINENIALKKSNRTLKNTLVIVFVTVIGILITISVAKGLEEKTKQRV